MSTLIVSDLHLGNRSGHDLLRSARVRSWLLDALGGVDRVVLLGDVLELRHGPAHQAMAAARALFEELGVAMSGREIVLTPGNHDHGLYAPWLAQRSHRATPTPLALEQRPAPEECSPLVQTLAAWAGPASLSVAFPGLWVRPDVYAIHGHYLDCHLTIPTMERLAIAGTARALGLRPQALSSVDAYEAVTSPVYAWVDAIASHAPTGAVLNGSATVRVWRALGGGRARGRGSVSRGRRSLLAPSRRGVRSLRARALAAGFPVAVAALNRAGLGPLRADISAEELRRAGLRAMGEATERLGLGDAHVVFGHTHRAGPLPSDDAEEWRGPAGARLINAGSWTYSDAFLTRVPGESPYWPGCCVVIGDDGPPMLRRLMAERTHAELAAS